MHVALKTATLKKDKPPLEDSSIGPLKAPGGGGGAEKPESEGPAWGADGDPERFTQTCQHTGRIPFRTTQESLIRFPGNYQQTLVFHGFKVGGAGGCLIIRGQHECVSILSACPPRTFRKGQA